MPNLARARALTLTLAHTYQSIPVQKTKTETERFFPRHRESRLRRDVAIPFVWIASPAIGGIAMTCSLTSYQLNCSVYVREGLRAGAGTD